MDGPGEVVSAVVLHRQPDVEHEEQQLSERVAAQEQRVDGGEEAEWERLPDARVLRAQHEGGRWGNQSLRFRVNNDIHY